MVTTQALTNIFDHFDRNLLTPYAVGFDRVFDRLNNYVVNQNHMTPTGFPPYNIRTEMVTIIMSSRWLLLVCLRMIWKFKLQIGTLTVRSLRKEESEQDAGYKRMAGEEFLHRGISYQTI